MTEPTDTTPTALVRPNPSNRSGKFTKFTKQTGSGSCINTKSVTDLERPPTKGDTEKHLKSGPSSSLVLGKELTIKPEVEGGQTSDPKPPVLSNREASGEPAPESQRLIERSAHPVVPREGRAKRKPVEMSSSSVRCLAAYFLAELIGTFLLVIIGDGAISAYVLTRREVDLFCACFAFGVGAMIATFASAKISGAHINPAASLAFALDGKLKWSLLPVYLAAQYLGGFLAASLLFLNSREAINSIDGGAHSASGGSTSTGHIFATYPGAWVSAGGSLLDQVVGTSILLFSLSAVCDKRNLGLKDRNQPLVVAFVIGITCVAFSPNCGAIFNPARDLAPRLLTALAGYQSPFEPAEGLYWLLAGVLGPHLGAVLGLFGYKLLIGWSLDATARERDRKSALDTDEPGEKRRNQLSHHQYQVTRNELAMAGGPPELTSYGSAGLRH